MQMNGLTMGFDLGSAVRPIGATPGGGASITATIAPNLSALDDSQTPADGYAAGTYSSTGGTISSAVETYLVNGTAQGPMADLAAGDIVQVSVLVSDSAANSQVFTTGPVTVSAASAATLTIAATRGSDQVAPEGIWFEATPAGFDVSLPTGGDIYDPTFHDILYVWSFDDVGTFPGPVKIPDSWDDKNIGYGRHVCHVFDGPGTYSVTCTAYDRSGTVKTSALLSITVKDAATQWPGTRTICVALDGVFTGAPAGADTYTTMAAAEAAYKALGNPGRLLLKRGETYTFADNRVRNTYPNFHLAAWGTGARPIVTNKLWINDMASAKDATIGGLGFLHGWDSASETGMQTDGVTFDNQRHGVIHDCVFDGCEKGIYIHTVTSGSFIMQDVNITNWRDYGTLLSVKGTTRVGWKGCVLHQHVDALGSGVTTGSNNKHGPMRWAGDDGTILYMGCVDLFSNNGRTASGGVPHHQPAFRTSGGSNLMFINMDRVSLEGGIHQLALTDTAASRQCLATNIVVDKFVCVGSYATQYNIMLGLGATTLRNGVLIQPDTPQTASWRTFIAYDDAQDTLNNRTEPVKTYNVSFANLLSDGNDGTVNGAPWFSVATGKNPFDSPTEDNNIEHQPNSVSLPDTGDTPLDTTELWAARNKGMQYAGFALDTSYAPPVGSVALYGAAAPSAAKGDATSGVVAIDDINGNQRAANPSRGPLD